MMSRRANKYDNGFTEKDFLVTTREEMDARGWDQLDVIIVSGDAYIDSPFIGIASGIRYDLINEDKKDGYKYLKEIVKHHISGQLKVAPPNKRKSSPLRLALILL